MSQCPSCGGICEKSGCERADYVPPQRELVWLTSQEVAAIAESVYGSAHPNDITFGMELQIKLKEKNT